MSCPDQPACHAGVLKRNNAFLQLRSAGNSALDALEALSSLHAGISEEPPRWQGQELSFSLLKKHCLQLSVQAHKCTRLLQTITGKEDEALRAVLADQLQQLGQVLEWNPKPGEEELLLPLTADCQHLLKKYLQDGINVCLTHNSQCQAFILNRAASRCFFQAAGLFPRINHALQQIDPSNWTSLASISAKIQYLIKTCPLPADVQDAIRLGLQGLLFLEGTPTISLFPQVHSEDGSRSSFAGLCPAKRWINWREASAVELAYKNILASLYSPQCVAYMHARGLRHEHTELSVLCLPDAAIPAAPHNDQQATGAADQAFPVAASTGKALNPIQSAEATLLLQGRHAISGGAGVVAGTIRILRSPADAVAFSERTIAVVEKACTGWVHVLPKVACLLVEEEHSACHLLTLAGEFRLPVICGLRHASSIVCDGMPVTVDITRGAVYDGIVEKLAETTFFQPNTTAGSPAEKALQTLCTLTGIANSLNSLSLTRPLSPLTAANPSCCTSMLDLVRWCRFTATQALLQQGSCKGILPLVPALRFLLYDIEGLLPASATDQKVFIIKAINAPLLNGLWQGMTQELEKKPDPVSMLDASALKNSVLLGGKYCTLQIMGLDFFLYLEADTGGHGENFRLVVLLQDMRLHHRVDRLFLLANRLRNQGFTVQAEDDGITAVCTQKSRQAFEQGLHLLGALTIQALA